MVEGGESQWRNLERMFGFVKLEKDGGVSSFASRMTQGSSLVIMIEQEQFLCNHQELSCARQKLREVKRQCRSVWHSVADGVLQN